MKKVRIMLTAIVVLGVVGGALAFKAKKSEVRFCFYKKTVDPLLAGACNIRSLITPGFETVEDLSQSFATVLPTLTSTTTDITIACAPVTGKNCNTQITLTEE